MKMRVAALFTVALAGFAAAAPAPIETDVKKGDIQVLVRTSAFLLRPPQPPF